MSVTFFIPGAPTEQYAPYDDEPEYTESRPVAPFSELNLSNSNAAAVLRLADPTGAWGTELCGEWAGAKLEYVHKRIMIALNTGKGGEMLKGSVTDGNFWEGGRDAEYVQDRLTRLLSIVVVATANSLPVSFG